MDPVMDLAVNRWGCNHRRLTGAGFMHLCGRKSGWAAAGVCKEPGLSRCPPSSSERGFHLRGGTVTAEPSGITFIIPKGEGGGSDKGSLLRLCLSSRKGSPCRGIHLTDQNCGMWHVAPKGAENQVSSIIAILLPQMLVLCNQCPVFAESHGLLT